MHEFRFTNKFVSIDPTVIDLYLSPYDWAKFRRTKGAVTLPSLLDHDGCLPCFDIITDGKVHDVKAAHQMGPPQAPLLSTTGAATTTDSLPNGPTARCSSPPA